MKYLYIAASFVLVLTCIIFQQPMTWLLATFAAGSFLFWFVIVTGIILIEALIDYDEAESTTVTFVLLLLFLNFVAGIPIFTTAIAYPFATGAIVLGYFLIVGPLFLLYKWRSRNRESRYKYEGLLKQFKWQHGVSKDAELPTSLRADFQRTLYGIVVNPNWRQYKSELFIWWAYWPFSAAWTLLNDPIKRLWREVLRFLSVQLDKITKSAWAGTEKDLTPPDKDKNKITNITNV